MEWLYYKCIEVIQRNPNSNLPKGSRLEKSDTRKDLLKFYEKSFVVMVETAFFVAWFVWVRGLNLYAMEEPTREIKVCGLLLDES